MARMPGVIPDGTVDEDMVNIMDLAPTFLEVAGLDKPDCMPATSLLARMKGKKAAVDNYVITGRERHVATARDLNLPYPHRAIRTKEFLYIKNFEPDRWPMGDPCGLDDPALPPPDYDELCNNTMVAYADFDAGPTKAWMIHHRSEPEYANAFELGFGKRPAEELYDIKLDPHQITNQAYNQDYAKIKQQLNSILMAELKRQKDPRVCEEICRFEKSPYTDIDYDRDKDQDRLARS